MIGMAWNRTIIFAWVGMFAVLADGAALAQVQRPSDEAAFTALPGARELQEKSADASAPNRIIDGRMRKDIRNQFCTAFRRYKGFRNWTAVVKDISDNESSHTAGVELDIGDNIKLEVSEVPDTTALFKAISELREGQEVVISGSFDHASDDDDSDPDCTYYIGPFYVHLSGIRSTRH